MAVKGCVVSFPVRSGTGAQVVNAANGATTDIVDRYGNAFVGLCAINLGFWYNDATFTARIWASLGFDDASSHIGVSGCEPGWTLGISSFPMTAVSQTQSMLRADYPGFINTVTRKGHITSFALGLVNIQWDVNDMTGDTCHMLVLGGDFQCQIVSFSMANTAAEQTFSATGLTFTPDSMVLTRFVGSEGAGQTAAQILGVCSSDVQGCISCYSDITPDVSETFTQSMLREGRCGLVLSGSTPTLEAGIEFKGWVTNGFKMQADPAGTTNASAVWYALCFKGVVLDILSLLQPSTTGLQSKGYHTRIDPKGAIIVSMGRTATTSPQLDWNLSIGITDGTRQYSGWSGEKSLDPTNDIATHYRNSTKFQTVATGHNTPASSTLRSQAAFSSMTSSAFAVNWTTVDGPAYEHLVFLFGEVPLAAEDCGCFVPLSGPTLPFAETFLADRYTYHYGPKLGLLTDLGEIVRALSDHTGAPESPDASLTLFDRDGDWRARAANADPNVSDFVGLYVAIFAISEEDRRNEVEPAILFRGMIEQHRWTDDLRLQLQLGSYISQCMLSLKDGDPQELPYDLWDPVDFPNCTVEKVVPGCRNYEVNGSVSIGATTIPVKTGFGVFPIGAKFRINNTGTTYTVAFGSGSDPETSVEIDTALTVGLSNNDDLVFLAEHSVEPASKKRVPIVYGYIGDQNRIAAGGFPGQDNGDGQAKLIYLGDRVLPNGRTYGEFGWCGHRCYSPGGRPFEMFYPWQNAMEAGEPTTWYYEGVAYSLGTLTQEAGDTSFTAGTFSFPHGRLVVPGYSAWTNMGLGSGNSYVTYNGHDYTVMYAESIFRDIFLGIIGAPANLGGEPLRVGAFGWADPDDSSVLLTKAGKAYLHFLNNYIFGHYRGGVPLTTPTFPDGVPLIDEASFAVYDAEANRRVPGGCEVNFILSPNGERTWRKVEAIQIWNQNLDCQIGENEDLQVCIVIQDFDSTTALSGIATVNDVHDILEEPSNKMEMVEEAERQANQVREYDTEDYILDDFWRSSMRGDNLISLSDAVDRHCGILAPELKLYLIRCQNRSIDSDRYAQGNLWVDDLVPKYLSRVSVSPRLYKVPLMMRGANSDFKLGQNFYVVHGRNVGGLTPRPVRVHRIRVRPGTSSEGRVVTLEGYDQVPILT